MFSRATICSAPRRSPLSASLAVAVGVSLSLAAWAEPSSKNASGVGAKRSLQPSTPHVVNTCADDDSPGSLRAIVASMNTADGDTIDLTQLPMGCSTITLDDATHNPSSIMISQPNLHLMGPGTGLSIRGGSYSYDGILHHTGNGTLEIEGLIITNSMNVSDSQPFGGCIYSNGSVSLKNSRVTQCTALGTSAVSAVGGAVYAHHDLTLDRSSITHSSAYNAFGSGGVGGGAFVGGNLKTSYATIGNNYAFTVGGGAVAYGDANTLSSSTISSNWAQNDGGLYFGNSMGKATIVNSTISSNETTTNVGALYAYGALELINSTVAFNHSNGVTSEFSGVNVAGASLLIESSVVAGNGGAQGPGDLWVAPTTMVTGSHNLFIAASGLPALPSTVSACPKLGPLADNGGATLTHAIASNSPAHDMGSNTLSLIFDQSGNLRSEGAAADIGALEWRDGIGEDRILAEGFDGLCDQ